MEDKKVQDSKKLAYPKWKTFFDVLLLLGILLLIAKLIIIGLNHFVNTNIRIPVGFPKVLSNFLPLTLMIIGAAGSEKLKNIYIE